ncbi:unnamed protein product, partial [Musa banksii]
MGGRVSWAAEGHLWQAKAVVLFGNWRDEREKERDWRGVYMMERRRRDEWLLCCDVAAVCCCLLW